MQVEIYEEKKDLSEIDQVQHESWLEDLSQRKSLADKLGLHALASKCAQEGNRAKVKQMISFPLLQGEELEIWQKFLPSTYSEDGKAQHTFSYRGAKLDAYAFDLIPISVLELWATLKDDKVFDTYEIWTPERQVVDPILLGFRKKIGPFLLARWGESLQAFEEIKESVKGMVAESRLTLSAFQQAREEMMRGQANLLAPSLLQQSPFGRSF